MNHDRKSAFYTVDPEKLSTARLHNYLLSSVAPRPIALVSSSDMEGNINLSPFSYFNVFGANPPILIFSPARRVRDNTTKHTLENARANPDVVVNMVDYAMVEQMSLSSTEYAAWVDEFVKSGLTKISSETMQVPRVAESPVAFECRVEQIVETGVEGGAGNLVICRVLRIHIREDLLDKDQEIDPKKLDLVARMGGNWYCRTGMENMFEIPKPVKTHGIGVDQLPNSARNSTILSGNDLGRLGNMPKLPEARQIDQIRVELEKDGLFEIDRQELLIRVHTMVKECLRRGENEKALALLWLAEG